MNKRDCEVHEAGQGDDWELASRLENDAHDVAQFEVQELHEVVRGFQKRQRRGGLVGKLQADPDQRFKISEHSSYGEAKWTLLKRAHSKSIVVPFNSELEGGNVLKRVLVYHLIPQFNPSGRLKSFNSTTTYAHGFTYLETHLLVANGLNASAEHVRAISASLLNGALDRARDEASPRQYLLLYAMVVLWIELSSQKLIPEELCLDIPLRLIETKERRRDLVSCIASTAQGWKPFSHDDLTCLMEYALFWTTHAIPEILGAQNYLVKTGISTQKNFYLIRRTRDADFESNMSRVVDGIPVCGYAVSMGKQSSEGKKGQLYEYTIWGYAWYQQMLESIDKVRDAILVWVALLTGLRNGELGRISFGDVVKRSDGEWEVDVSRFKTSNDPNYLGDADTIPIPTFIGEAIESFREIRSFRGCWRKGLLFEQVSNSRESNVLARTTARALQNLGARLGIDGIHPHRFRKTIAEIIINRSERNIDLIRALFGHKSYRMSLRYIARNPYLVGSVAETMESHFAKDFLDVVAGVRDGGYSGIAAQRIATVVSRKPDSFKGVLLKLTIVSYLAHLLESGEPIFIKRTGIGMYCLSGSTYTSEQPPPCRIGRALDEGKVVPDPSNCQLGCKSIVLLDGAKATLEQNVAFYTNLLSGATKTLNRAVEREIVAKINVNAEHLAQLERSHARPAESSGQVEGKAT